MKRRLTVAAVVVVAAAVTIVMLASAAPSVPVPNPIVAITTTSGGVTKTTPVPMGGVPVPIDVDGTTVLGALTPDIEVSVGLISVDELPGKVVVPNITVRRHALALAQGADSPPLRLNAHIDLVDAANGLQSLAVIDYGFTTPPNTRMPSVLTTKLVGPILGGFVDPLEAKISSPGYGGALDFHLNVRTPDLDGRTTFGFDRLPENLYLLQDSRTDGLDVLFEHDAPVDEVNLDAAASLRNRDSNEVHDVKATVDRLPRRISLTNTYDGGDTNILYESSSNVALPDVTAQYRRLDPSGATALDAAVEIAELPLRMRGRVRSVQRQAGEEIDRVEFEVLDGGRVGAVEFAARNWSTNDFALPEPNLSPAQFVSFATRQDAAGTTRWRAAGRIEQIRSATYAREGDDGETIDLTADLGDGVKPVRALADLDDRGPGGPADPADQRRITVDTTLRPLPRGAHVRVTPSQGPESTTILYEAAQRIDLDADVGIFGAPPGGTADECGHPSSTCAVAHVDRVPTHLEIELPGLGASDYRVSHDSPTGALPDVSAQVDRTAEDPEDRVWVDVRLKGVPPEVRGRLDATDTGVVRAAEFHACRFDFATGLCLDAQRALREVLVVARDHPGRAGLPGRRKTVENYVSVIGADPDPATEGDDRFEVAARIDEVRNVAFHQRDANDDGKADGTLGALVDVSTPDTPFDAVVDVSGNQRDEASGAITPTSTVARVHVDDLPQRFSTCMRPASTADPDEDNPPPADAMLAPCDRLDVLGYAPADLDVTPLSVFYSASEQTRVEGSFRSTGPDPKERDASNHPVAVVSDFAGVVDAVPAEVRADVISAEGRQLEVGYSAKDAAGLPATIDRIELRRLQLRRANSICRDPRANRRATCASAVIEDFPSGLTLRYDPDPQRGTFVVESDPPLPGRGRPSLTKLHLDTVSPDAGEAPLLLDAAILGLTPRVSGRLKRAELDATAEGLELAELSVNACRDAEGVDRCTGLPPFGRGVQRVELEAANTLVPEALPDPPPAPAGTDGRAELIARPPEAGAENELFKADVEIPAFRDVLVSRLHPEDDARDLAGTRMHVAFGEGTPSEEIRGYVDRRQGNRQVLADLSIDELPSGVNLCLRQPVDPEDVDAGSPVWCEQQDSARTVLQLAADEPIPLTQRPDIDIRRLLLRAVSRAELLHGSVEIRDLGERIDVHGPPEPREGSGGVNSCGNGDDDDGNGFADGNDDACKDKGADVLVEGRTLDGQVDDIAGRVTFELQNYLFPFDETQIAPLYPIFPFAPVDQGATQPEDDPDTVDTADGAHNYLKALSSEEFGTLYLSGSIPRVRRVGIAPGRCEMQGGQDVVPLVERAQYQCLQASVGRRGPLGLVFRRLTPGDQALAIEEGLIDRMPSGDGGIKATLTTVPKDLDFDPPCGSGTPAGTRCRPQVISLESDHAGQTPRPALQARIATGDLALLRQLRGEEPLDQASRRLDYEQPPSEWGNVVDLPPEDVTSPQPTTLPLRGARIKVGTDAEKSAVRLGIKLDVPRFLDLWTPSIWSCSHLEAPDPETCEATGVGPGYNRGHKSQDLFVKAVAAENRHDGVGHPYLGRFAVLLHDFEKGHQRILTGVKAPDGPDGSSSLTPETIHTLPDGDASLFGARLPGHLDVRLNIRNHYDSVESLATKVFGDEGDQREFTQIDGRINRPLSLTLRINEDLKKTRGDRLVPDKSVSAFNLPGTDEQDSFDRPSFRVRAEIREHAQNLQRGVTVISKALQYGGLLKGLLKDDHGLLQAFKNGFGGKLFKFPTFGPILPSGDEIDKHWIDVKLNADPTSNGVASGDPARTVDVVAGPFGIGNQAEIRGFRDVLDNPLPDGDGPDNPRDVGKGPGVPITPQAAVRLSDVELGFTIGVNFLGVAGAEVGFADELDIIPKITGRATERTFLRNAITGVLRRAGDSGFVDVDFDAKAQFHLHAYLKLLWWTWKILDIPFSSKIDQPMGLQTCLFGIGPDDGRALIFLPPDAADFLSPGLFPAVMGTAFSILSGTLLNPVSCALNNIGDEKGILVDQRHPAPRYDVANRDVPGTGDVSAPPEPPPADAPDPDDDVVIDQDTVRCGTLGGDDILVTNGATLRVGRPGQVDDRGIPCDGALEITATNLTVHQNAAIRADRLIAGGRGAGSSGGGGGQDDHGGHNGVEEGRGQPYDEPPIPEENTQPERGDEGPDFGSQGGDGTGGAEGGRGGGELVITTTDDLRVRGEISANGGGGDPGAADCDAIAGGGGSGGRVYVKTQRLLGDGRIEADGGDGGDGGIAGGGGSGGRVRVDQVVRQSVDRSAGGGDGGDSECTFQGGHGGDNGTDNLGRLLRTMSEVSLHPDTPGPLQKSGTVKLHVRALNDFDDELQVLVCANHGDPDLPLGVDSTELNPDPTRLDSARQIAQAAEDCTVVGFEEPTGSGSEYVRDIEVEPGEGFHGFFAIAARPFEFPNISCLSSSRNPLGIATCSFQPGKPDKASARIGVDQTGPVASNLVVQGVDGCPGPSLCVRQNQGTLSFTATDEMSDVGKVLCGTLFAGQLKADCGDGTPHTVQIGSSDGLKTIQLIAFDQVENLTGDLSFARWFVDKRPPNPARPQATFAEPPVNGWHHGQPQISVSATDPSPSSGFVEDGLRLLVDGDTVRCGFDVAGDTNGPSTSSCSPSDFAGDLEPLPDGEHVLTLRASDRAGNPSGDSAEERFKLDNNPPTTSIVLDPEDPDGEDGWYGTRPFFAFATSDPGGSGVDPTQPGSGVRFKIDDRPWQTWNPEDPESTRLGDGVHSVCFYAIDVAGRAESDVEQGGSSRPPKCRSGIRVDTTAPEVAVEVNPSPNPTSGYHHVPATVSATAEDPVPSGVGEVSGVATIEMQVNDGAWVETTSREVGEGSHTVRVRAIDRAGGISETAERLVRVDLSDPAISAGLFPPQPNVRGWFNRIVKVSGNLADDRFGSGPAQLRRAINAGALEAYLGPVRPPEGPASVRFEGEDRAGRVAAPVTRSYRSDLTPPTGRPTGERPDPLLVSGVTGSTTTLRFTAADAAGDRVRVLVCVHDLLGAVQRCLQPASGPDGYRAEGTGSVAWDGRKADGKAVLPGLYHYRVRVTDEAGNAITSRESPSFTVLLAGLPL